jgi:hypothetical protein
MLPKIGDFLGAIGVGLDFFDRYIDDKKSKYPDAAGVLEEFRADVHEWFAAELTGNAAAEAMAQLAQFARTWRSEAPPDPTDIA